MNQYILQQSTSEGWWVATDTLNGIVIRFKERDFNDSQQVAYLPDTVPSDPLTIARQIRELTDWLVENHRNIL